VSDVRPSPTPYVAVTRVHPAGGEHHGARGDEREPPEGPSRQLTSAHATPADDTATEEATTCPAQARERTTAHIAEALYSTGDSDGARKADVTSTMSTEQDTVLTAPHVMVSTARLHASATKHTAACNMPACNARPRHTTKRSDAPNPTCAPVRPQVNSGRVETPTAEPRRASGESATSMEQATTLHTAHAMVRSTARPSAASGTHARDARATDPARRPDAPNATHAPTRTQVEDGQTEASAEASEAELGAVRAREQDEDLRDFYEQHAEVRDALPHCGRASGHAHRVARAVSCRSSKRATRAAAPQRA
jgi:hypothetical protein